MKVVVLKAFRFPHRILRRRGETIDVSPRYGKMFVAAKMARPEAMPVKTVPPVEDDDTRGRPYRRRDMRAEDDQQPSERRDRRSKRDRDDGE